MDKHKHHGVVTSVSEHHSSPDHLRVEVAHGKRKKPKKGSVTSYDDRPTSTLMVKKALGPHYPVGKSVHVGMSPARSKAPSDGYDKTMRKLRSRTKGGY